MREIKFRAWEKERKEMVKVDELDFEMNYLTYDDGIVSSPMTSFEIMQFTGLKDKNEKEIYEGDIVEYGTIIRRGQVVFFEIEGAFIIEDFGTKYSYPLTVNNLKVIGNKFENPEFGFCMEKEQ